jgi:hypothetical protein
MSKLHYKTKVDLVVAAVTVAIGCFFTYQVSLIESIAEDAIGPRMIPYFLSITMVALDPERELATASGRRVHTFGSQSVADTVSVAVIIDPNGVVAEAREGNNAKQAALVCEN